MYGPHGGSSSGSSSSGSSSSGSSNRERAIARHYSAPKKKTTFTPRGGGPDMGTVSTPTRKANPVLVARAEAEQRKTDYLNTERAIRALANEKYTPKRTISGGINRILNNPFVRTYAAWGTGGISEILRQAMMAKHLYDNRYILDDEAIEKEVSDIPVTGGITGGPISFNQTPQNQSNIAYDDRLGYVDLNTGQSINMAMPGATQAGVSDKQKQVIGGQMFGLKEGMFTPQDVYDKTKTFDDTGIFGIGADPMTKQEFNEYIKSQGYAGPGLELADGGLINFYKYGGFIG